MYKQFEYEYEYDCEYAIYAYNLIHSGTVFSWVGCWNIFLGFQRSKSLQTYVY